MGKQEQRAYLEAIRARYRRANKADKSLRFPLIFTQHDKPPEPVVVARLWNPWVEAVAASPALHQ
ncbi:MAG: hypothetical protein A2Z94_01765 [Gallionellales bacterium GWA2_55_18]|nr:MAG: hypothetical protein A2Z94_01765 [Gallionellales bacterium GWA2_55_18]